MTDVEKVINDLNVAKQILCNSQMLTFEMYIKIGQVITDAIVLLKEQEAKSPSLMQDEENIWFICPKCGHKLRAFLALPNAYCPKFCSECGQKVKWDIIKENTQNE